ncbi:MAG: ArsR family transcriptional regulator [candidate division WOR-3 bacterium]|nr:ArsR family transcriptional regulator [candidate division WOR-3 bacterium]
MRQKMAETHYRASRFCRVLGNPTAYQILRILTAGKKMPTELSFALGLSIKTISEVLRNLRQVDLVRYDTINNRKVYYLKDPAIKTILKTLENYTDKMRFKKW